MKRKNATEFSAKTRQIIKARDKGCIFCAWDYRMEKAREYSTSIFSIMHYIPRSHGGLGIEQNGAVGCMYHHEMLDNGNGGHREEMLNMFKVYLQCLYPGWNEEDCKYNKWSFLD